MALQSEYNGLDTGYNLGTLAENSRIFSFGIRITISQDLAATSGPSFSEASYVFWPCALWGLFHVWGFMQWQMGMLISSRMEAPLAAKFNMMS